MKKAEAMDLLGGSVLAAALKVGISTQAVRNWPDDLTDKLRDRVQAALWRDYVARVNAETRHREAVRREAEAIAAKRAHQQSQAA